MRKQLRAADLYQAFTGIERLPQIKGVGSCGMQRVLFRAQGDAPQWLCEVTFVDGVTIAQTVETTADVHAFVTRVNQVLRGVQTLQGGKRI